MLTWESYRIYVENLQPIVYKFIKKVLFKIASIVQYLKIYKNSYN